MINKLQRYAFTEYGMGEDADGGFVRLADVEEINTRLLEDLRNMVQVVSSFNGDLSHSAFNQLVNARMTIITAEQAKLGAQS